jgi:hypothetical protein
MCACVHVWLYACADVWMCACMQVWMCACMHAFTSHESHVHTRKLLMMCKSSICFQCVHSYGCLLKAYNAYIYIYIYIYMYIHTYIHNIYIIYVYIYIIHGCLVDAYNACVCMHVLRMHIMRVCTWLSCGCIHASYVPGKGRACTPLLTPRAMSLGMSEMRVATSTTW